MSASILCLIFLAAIPLSVSAGTIQINTPPGLFNHCPQDDRETFGQTTFEVCSKLFAQSTSKAITIGIPFEEVNHDDEHVAAFWLGITAGLVNSPIIITQFTPNDFKDATKGGKVGKSVVAKLPASYVANDASTHFQMISFATQGLSLKINKWDYLLATIPAGSTIQWAATCNGGFSNAANNDHSPASFVVYNNALPAEGSGISFSSVGLLGSNAKSPSLNSCSSSQDISPVFGFQLQSCYDWVSTCPSSNSTCTNPRLLIDYECEDQDGNVVQPTGKTCKISNKPTDVGQYCDCVIHTYKWIPKTNDCSKLTYSCPLNASTGPFSTQYICVDETGKTVDDSYCAASSPKPSNIVCPCNYNWVTGCPLSSVTCSTPLIKVNYTCHDQFDQVVANSYCGPSFPESPNFPSEGSACDCQHIYHWKSKTNTCPTNYTCPVTDTINGPFLTIYQCVDENDNVVVDSYCTATTSQPKPTYCPCSYHLVGNCPSTIPICSNTPLVSHFTCKDQFENTVANSNCFGINPPPNSTPEGENCPCQSPETYHWVSDCPSDPIPVCTTPRLTLSYICENNANQIVSNSLCPAQKPLPPSPIEGSDCPCKEPPGGFVIGDPVFSGFHGQAYQVHGLPGSVFNIFTHSQVQINARFELINQGRSQDTINAIKSSSSIKLPDTAAWTHPGTYLGEISIQTQFAKVSFKSGKFESGIESCLAENKSGEKSDLANVNDVFYLSEDQKQFVKRVSSHAVELVTPVLKMQLVNSDHFFNIQSASLSRSIPSSEVSGLLGGSASPTFKKWNGQQVLEFLVTPVSIDDLTDLLHKHNREDMFGAEFKRNKFVI